MYTAFLHCIKSSALCNQNCKCLYCLWSRTWPTKTLWKNALKNCVLGTTTLAKNSDKEKWKKFDGKSEWTFGNNCARNVIIFGVDNSS